jgi:hypothetical protein
VRKPNFSRMTELGAIPILVSTGVFGRHYARSVVVRELDREP